MAHPIPLTPAATLPRTLSQTRTSWVGDNCSGRPIRRSARPGRARPERALQCVNKGGPMAFESGGASFALRLAGDEWTAGPRRRGRRRSGAPAAAATAYASSWAVCHLNWTGGDCGSRDGARFPVTQCRRRRRCGRARRARLSRASSKPPWIVAGAPAHATSRVCVRIVVDPHRMKSSRCCGSPSGPAVVALSFGLDFLRRHTDRSEETKHGATDFDCGGLFGVRVWHLRRRRLCSEHEIGSSLANEHAGNAGRVVQPRRPREIPRDR